MFTVYVLYSQSHNKIYIGYTSNLEQRLLSHNGLGSKGWTKNYRPWILVYSETIDLKKDAMKREKELKTAAGRRFIWDIIYNR